MPADADSDVIVVPALQSLLQASVFPRLQLRDLLALQATSRALRIAVRQGPDSVFQAAAKRSGVPAATYTSQAARASAQQQIRAAAEVHQRVRTCSPHIECAPLCLHTFCTGSVVTVRALCRLIPQRRVLGAVFSPDLSLLCFTSLASPVLLPRWTAAAPLCGHPAVQITDVRTARVVKRVRYPLVGRTVRLASAQA